MQAEVLSDGYQMVEAGGEDRVAGPWRFRFPCPEPCKRTASQGESGSEQNPASVLRDILVCRRKNKEPLGGRLVLVSVPGVSRCGLWTHGFYSDSRRESGELVC